MLIIGEKINATRKRVAEAIAARDRQHIIELATAQASAGADFIDVNGGDPRPQAEVANIEWLVGLVQEHCDKPLAIDTANADAMRAALKLARSKPIVNSITLETDRLASYLPLVSERECMVVALCMTDDGPPTGVADRVERAGRLVEALRSAGRRADEIIIDPCFLPVASDGSAYAVLCEAIARIRREVPGVYVGGGVSNASHGLPARRWINQAVLTGAILAGMNAAIVDPCAPGIIPTIRAAEAAGGADEWCMNYITAYREGKLS